MQKCFHSVRIVLHAVTPNEVACTRAPDAQEPPCARSAPWFRSRILAPLFFTTVLGLSWFWWMQDSYSHEEGFHVRTSRTLDHSMHVGRHTIAQSAEIHSFGVHFVNVVNCGKGEAAHTAGATRRKKNFPRYGAAHSHAQEPTPGSAIEFWGERVCKNHPLVPRSNIAGSWARGGGGTLFRLWSVLPRLQLILHLFLFVIPPSLFSSNKCPPPPRPTFGRTWPTAKAFAFLCVDSTQRSETGQVRGLRWHNRPREREGKECGEADGHGGLQRERPREGKGEGRGKVRARRKRKVKGW